MRRLLVIFLLGCPSHAPDRTEAHPEPATSQAPTFTPDKITTADAAMGTHLSFAAYTSPRVDEAAVRKAFADAIAEIRRIEAVMTTWRPDSEMSRSTTPPASPQWSSAARRTT